MSKKFTATGALRFATWTEECYEPRRHGGEILIGGGSHKVTRSEERLEQKWISSNGEEEWRPVEKIFVESYCKKIKEESHYDLKDLNLSKEEMKDISELLKKARKEK